MNHNQPIFKASEVKAGDVLVFYSIQSAGKEGCETGYCHAAISIGNGQILESGSSGVKIITTEEAFDTYDHAAVLRATALWTGSRIERLKKFGEQQVGKKFNPRAIYRIEVSKQAAIDTAHEQLELFFSNNQPVVESEREKYFCSELVVCAFIEAKIIDAPAAIVLKPETFAPMDIAQDKVFGFFAGYITKEHNYEIPERDFFLTNI